MTKDLEFTPLQDKFLISPPSFLQSITQISLITVTGMDKVQAIKKKNMGLKFLHGNIQFNVRMMKI